MLPAYHGKGWWTKTCYVCVWHEWSNFKVALVVKNLSANAGDMRDMGAIPGLGKSPGGGNGYPLQYSCPENSVDREVWQATYTP